MVSENIDRRLNFQTAMFMKVSGSLEQTSVKEGALFWWSPSTQQVPSLIRMEHIIRATSPTMKLVAKAELSGSPDGSTKATGRKTDGTAKAA